MLRITLFWLLRVLAVAFTLTNIIYIQPDGIWGYLAVAVGLIACVNLYMWGLFCRETNKSAPGAFIILRVVQGVLVFVFDAMPIPYFATYILMDLIFYLIWMYDSKFMFIYVEPKDERNSKIRRV